MCGLSHPSGLSFSRKNSHLHLRTRLSLASAVGMANPSALVEHSAFQSLGSLELPLLLGKRSFQFCEFSHLAHMLFWLKSSFFQWQQKYSLLIEVVCRGYFGLATRLHWKKESAPPCLPAGDTEKWWVHPLHMLALI